MKLTQDEHYLLAIELACNRLADDLLEKYGDQGKEMLLRVASILESKVKRSMN